jgi:hypothetical protein
MGNVISERLGRKTIERTSQFLRAYRGVPDSHVRGCKLRTSGVRSVGSEKLVCGEKSLATPIPDWIDIAPVVAIRGQAKDSCPCSNLIYRIVLRACEQHKMG